MVDALGFMAPVALAAIAFSLPEVVVMILLIQPGKRWANAYGFAAGLVFSFLAVSAVFLIAAEALDLGGSGERSTWVSILLLVIGVALLYLGLRKFLSRPHPDDPIEEAAILKLAANLTPLKAVSLGAVMGGFNPSFMALIGSLTAELTMTGASTGQKALVMLLFTLIGSAGVVGPLVAVQLFGERARDTLERVRDLLDTHMWLIMAVVFVYFGITLIGEGLRALT